jgi:Rieske Fe-S protein
MNRPKSRTKTDDHDHGSLKESDWLNRSCTHQGQQGQGPWLPKRHWIGRTTTNRPKTLTKTDDHGDHDHGSLKESDWRNRSCTHLGQQGQGPWLPKRHWTGRTTTNHPTTLTKTDDHDDHDHGSLKEHD